MDEGLGVDFQETIPIVLVVTKAHLSLVVDVFDPLPGRKDQTLKYKKCRHCCPLATYDVILPTGRGLSYGLVRMLAIVRSWTEEYNRVLDLFGNVLIPVQVYSWIHWTGH